MDTEQLANVLGQSAADAVTRLVDGWPELSPRKLAELRQLLRPEPVPQQEAA